MVDIFVLVFGTQITANQPFAYGINKTALFLLSEAHQTLKKGTFVANEGLMRPSKQDKVGNGFMTSPF